MCPPPLILSFSRIFSWFSYRLVPTGARQGVLLFVDEADAFLRRRSTEVSSRSEEEKVALNRVHRSLPAMMPGCFGKDAPKLFGPGP